jgi:hypothetical protein
VPLPARGITKWFGPSQMKCHLVAARMPFQLLNGFKEKRVLFIHQSFLSSAVNIICEYIGWANK